MSDATIEIELGSMEILDSTKTQSLIKDLNDTDHIYHCCCCFCQKASICRWISDTLFVLLLPMIFGIVLYFFPFLWNNYYFFVSMCGSIAFVLFYVFPFLCRWMHVKPTYYDDLIDLEASSIKEQKRFQVLFEKVMDFPLSIFVAALAYYCLHQIKQSTLHYFEIVGIVCGAISGFKTFQSNIGTLFLTWLHYRKTNHQQRRRSSQ